MKHLRNIRIDVDDAEILYKFNQEKSLVREDQVLI